MIFRQWIAILALLLLVPIVWPIYLTVRSFYWISVVFSNIYDLLESVQVRTIVALIRFIYRWGNK